MGTRDTIREDRGSPPGNPASGQRAGRLTERQAARTEPASLSFRQINELRALPGKIILLSDRKSVV